MTAHGHVTVKGRRGLNSEGNRREGREGGREDVPTDFLHHHLALLGLGRDALDFSKKLRDGRLGEGGREGERESESQSVACDDDDEWYERMSRREGGREEGKE